MKKMNRLNILIYIYMYIYLENVNIFYYINILIYLKDQFCGQINTKVYI